MRFDVHHYHNGLQLSHERMDLLFEMLRAINHKVEKIMSAADDLKAAITDLAIELTDNNTEIEALLTKIANSTGGTSDADVQAAIAQIRDLIASNKAEVDKAKAAVPA